MPEHLAVGGQKLRLIKATLVEVTTPAVTAVCLSFSGRLLPHRILQPISERICSLLSHQGNRKTDALSIKRTVSEQRDSKLSHFPDEGNNGRREGGDRGQGQGLREGEELGPKEVRHLASP